MSTAAQVKAPFNAFVLLRTHQCAHELRVSITSTRASSTNGFRPELSPLKGALDGICGGGARWRPLSVMPPLNPSRVALGFRILAASTVLGLTYSASAAEVEEEEVKLTAGEEVANLSRTGGSIFDYLRNGPAGAKKTAAESTPEVPITTELTPAQLFSRAVKAMGMSRREAIDDIETLHSVMQTPLDTEYGVVSLIAHVHWSKTGAFRTENTILGAPVGEVVGSDGVTVWSRATQTGAHSILNVFNKFQASWFAIQLSPHMQMLKMLATSSYNFETSTIPDDEMEFAGMPCVAIRFQQRTPKGNKYGRLYFDKETDLPLGWTIDGVDLRVSEWKTVDGVQYFHRMTQGPDAAGNEIEMTVTELSINSVAADFFALPDEVKALTKREEE